jgi:hypothetical protein
MRKERIEKIENNTKAPEADGPDSREVLMRKPGFRQQNPRIDRTGEMRLEGP